MTDDVETTTQPSTMDRRRFIRNASATGALVWVAPSITSAMPAFGATAGSEICEDIDAFTLTQFVRDTITTAAAQSTVATDGSFAATTRTIGVTAADAGGAAPGSGATLQVFPAAGLGRLDLSNDSFIESSAFVRYDGITADLSDRDRFRLDFSLVNTQGSNTVTFAITASDGATTETVSVQIGPADTGINFPFSAFGAVNFASLTSIQIDIDAPNSTDIQALKFRACYAN